MAKYGLNRLTLIGNLGRDPESFETKEGIPYARFTLACTEQVRTAQGAEDKTEWFRITVWRGQAEVARNYLRKGSSVYIEARLRNTEYETAQGEKRYGVEYDVTRLILLDKAPGGDNPGFNRPVSPTTQGQDTSTQTPLYNTNSYSSEPLGGGPVAQPETNDDLPF
ncbi:MAG: single-stranded DNA-binding protein [Bacteroidetes bacterium]|nr:MAG: single-stranded DNA-binding protein [Bacteroidota bacterium]